MSPKDFRKISHLEPELKTNEVSGDERTDEQTNTASPQVDPPGGQLKTFWTLKISPKVDLNQHFSGIVHFLLYKK